MDQETPRNQIHPTAPQALVRYIYICICTYIYVYARYVCIRNLVKLVQRKVNHANQVMVLMSESLTVRCELPDFERHDVERRDVERHDVERHDAEIL